MTLQKATKEIRKYLDALSKEKSDKEKLRLVLSIKLFVEVIEEPLKKRVNKKATAYAAKTRIIKNALKQLLTAFDKIQNQHEEIGDSDVRDRMYKAIYRSFIQPRRGHSLPNEFGTFCDKGNGLVHAALHKFLTHQEIVAASRKLKSPEDRFAAFQDDDVETSEGTICFEYFGYSNKVRVA
jgi:hypothetical protein